MDTLTKSKIEIVIADIECKLKENIRDEKLLKLEIEQINLTLSELTQESVQLARVRNQLVQDIA